MYPKNLTLTVGALCAALRVVLALGAAAVSAESSHAIELVSNCPPSFELTADNQCKLRTLYDGYKSLEDKGVGGLKTALPAVRDGFSPQQIDLGRYLFFDPLLSGDNRLSCASCHHPELGFADGRAVSVGIGGAEVPRAAPSLWNAGFLKKLFWDARADSLEQQMQGPLYSEVEMGSSPGRLLADIGGSAEYRRLFGDAFPGYEGPPTLKQIYTAIAAFESSLVSLNSRYDHYAHGYQDALTDNEKEGLNIFRSFVARCAECHTPPLFTNQQIAVIGVNEPAGRSFDPGAGAIFDNPTWRGGFKVPSLRNIARTAPYMHSGTFDTLRDATEFYNKGRGHALPPAEKQRMILHWHIWEPDLSDEEIDRLVDFMQTLTDESFAPRIPGRVPSGLPPVGTLPEALQTQTASKDHQ